MENLEIWRIRLVGRATKHVAATFRKRAAAGLQASRRFILPDEQDQVNEKTDLELVTWLVLKEL